MPENNRILLIDDEEVITFGFTKVLEEPGVVVDSAHSVKEAQALIAAHQYVAAIIDLRLTDSTENEGFSCIEFLRSTQKFCRILVLTAFGDNRLRAQAKELGVTFFFEKPVEPNAVKDILKTFGFYDR